MISWTAIDRIIISKKSSYKFSIVLIFNSNSILIMNNIKYEIKVKKSAKNNICLFSVVTDLHLQMIAFSNSGATFIFYLDYEYLKIPSLMTLKDGLGVESGYTSE